MTQLEPPRPDARDLQREDQQPLLKAARDLAAAVSKLEDPDPERLYGQAPRALIVGGFVRDLCLGLHPKDADIEVYGVAPEVLKELLTRMFGTVNEVGKAFGIIKVPIGDGLELDVSIPRRESKSGIGHKGFSIDSDPGLSIGEASIRRDFTVNAMSMDPITGVVHDPYGGLKDLRDRILRVTDMRRFQEDPLRVLRAAQFLARLEFTIAPESERLVHEMVARGDLAELPRKRVTDEIEKLLFKPARPSVGFDFLRRNKIVEAVFPESTVQDWEGWKQRIDATAATCQDHAVMLAAFLSGFTSSDRERVAISLEFKDNKNLAACALALLRESDRVESSPTNPANDARKTLRRIGPASPESYATWLLILGRREEGERFVSLVRENNLDARDLLRGRDLIDLFHLSPGPKFRQVLKAVESARDEGKINTRDEAIDLIRSSLMIF